MTTPNPSPAQKAPAGPTPVVTGLSAPPGTKGWLAGQSIFEQKDERKLGLASLMSALVHVALFAFIVILMSIKPAAQKKDEEPPKIDVVYLEKPGPSGGGGGSPAPAPPKKIEIPKPTDPTPVVVPVPIVPPPSISAPVENADVLSALGANSLSNANLAGGGSGGGIGSGHGNGIGPGEGGGTGGGVYQPGSGLINPVPIKSPDPKYTSDAMRAKIQGDVELEATVGIDGKLTDIVITKSLDKVNGLDQVAIETAKTWLFKPGILRQTGKAVPVRITILMSFTLR